MSRKIVIKYDYLQSQEISSKTALLKFDLAKSDSRHSSDSLKSSWPKVKFKEYFQNIFHFTFLFLQALFKRWINNRLKVILVIFTLYFLLYSIVLYCTQFNETWWEQPLRKTLYLQYQNRAMTHVFNKTKSRRQYVRFCGLSNWCCE